MRGLKYLQRGSKAEWRVAADARHMLMLLPASANSNASISQGSSVHGRWTWAKQSWKWEGSSGAEHMAGLGTRHMYPGAMKELTLLTCNRLQVVKTLWWIQTDPFSGRSCQPGPALQTNLELPERELEFRNARRNAGRRSVQKYRDTVTGPISLHSV